MSTRIVALARSHLIPLLRSLADQGWDIVRAPAAGRLVRNGQRVVLRAERSDLRIRLFVYKVTGSGRSRSSERRIEITTTYQKGLARDRRYRDLVLGYDADHRIYVGIDPERIDHGGPTGNASSFFDRAGLSWNNQTQIHVRPRAAKLFRRGIEYHAFFKPPRLSEYLFNAGQIHQGLYLAGGLFSTAWLSPRRKGRIRPLTVDDATGSELILEAPRLRETPRKLPKRLVAKYESGAAGTLAKQPVTPEELEEIQHRLAENGRLGEEFVLTHERRRLRRLGRSDLADKVRWVSTESVSAGYDIRSFSPSGEERWIEVKATEGKSRTFEISANEWRTCCENNAKYFIYRVTTVRQHPRLQVVADLLALEAAGRLLRSATGWRVTLA